MTTQKSSLEPAGWHIRDWCLATSVSRGQLYKLPEDQLPRSVTLGRRRIIIESPADWLKRIHREIQGVKS